MSDRGMKAIEKIANGESLSRDEDAELVAAMAGDPAVREAYDAVMAAERLVRGNDAIDEQADRLADRILASRATTESLENVRPFVAPAGRSGRGKILFALAAVLLIAPLAYLGSGLLSSTPKLPTYGIEVSGGQSKMLNDIAPGDRAYPGDKMTIILRPETQTDQPVTAAAFLEVPGQTPQRLDGAFERADTGALRWRGRLPMVEVKAPTQAKLRVYLGLHERQVQNGDQGPGIAAFTHNFQLLPPLEN